MQFIIFLTKKAERKVQTQTKHITFSSKGGNE